MTTECAKASPGLGGGLCPLADQSLAPATAFSILRVESG